MRLRAAIYARVSSTGQRDRHTIDGQLAVLRDYAKRNGWEVADEYIDDGRSAKTGQLDKRDGFARLLRDADAKRFDVLLVVDIDRMCRTDDMIERATILGPFQRNGIDIVTPSGGRLDLRSFLGELYATIQALGAADWLRKHKERIRAAKDLAISKGKKPAGPTPFGLDYDRETGAWSIDKAAGAIVHELFTRVSKREPCEAIAADLRDRCIHRPRGGVWIRERVWQIVRSRVYIGEYTADKRRGLVISVPAIVDVALFDRVQEVLGAQHRRGLRRTKHCYLLEELAVCSRCGARIGISSGSQANRTVPRYVCSHRRRPPIGAAACALPCVKTQSADDRLWRAVCSTLQRDDILAVALGRNAEAAADAAAWEQDLADVTKRKSRLTAAESAALARHRRGLVSDAALDHELVAICRERKMLDQQEKSARRALTSRSAAAAHAQSLAAALQSARAQLGALTPTARRHVIQAMFPPGSIVVGEPEIVATLRLSALSSGEGSSTSNAPEATLEIRLVA